METTWTPGEIDLFKMVRASKMKTRLVCKLFNISPDVMRRVTKRLNDSKRLNDLIRIYEEKPKPKQYTTKKCMTCDVEFESEGNHHRLCTEHRRESYEFDTFSGAIDLHHGVVFVGKERMMNDDR